MKRRNFFQVLAGAFVTAPLAVEAAPALAEAVTKPKLPGYIRPNLWIRQVFEPPFSDDPIAYEVGSMWHVGGEIYICAEASGAESKWVPLTDDET